MTNEEFQKRIEKLARNYSDEYDEDAFIAGSKAAKELLNEQCVSIKKHYTNLWDDSLILREKETSLYVEEIKRLTQQNAKERDRLQFDIEQFKSGVNNFKCFKCGHYSSPFVPVNLISEIKTLTKELDIVKVDYANCDAEKESRRLENTKLKEQNERYRKALETIAEEHWTGNMRMKIAQNALKEDR